MAGCSLAAPGLVSQVSGVAPVFQYTRPHSDDYFGIQMTYVQAGATCYGVNSIPKFTPVIQNTAVGFTRTCQFQTAPQYTGIYCPAAPVNAIPDGQLTVTFKGYTGAANTAPIPFTASFGPSPAAKTVTSTVSSTQTATQTSTAPGPFASTVTANGKYMLFVYSLTAKVSPLKRLQAALPPLSRLETVLLLPRLFTHQTLPSQRPT